MNHKERARIDSKKKWQEHFLRLLAGLRNLLFYRRWLFCIVAAYLLTAILVWQNREKLLFGLPVTSPLHQIFMLTLDGAMILLGVLGMGLLFLAFGTPFRAKPIQDRLVKVGFVNHLEEPPLLLAIRREDDDCIYEFDSNNIPLKYWNKDKDEVGEALRCTVVSADRSDDGKRIVVFGVPFRFTIPKEVYWKDKYLFRDDFKLVLGMGLSGLVTVDLAQNAHLLVGGGTGSGKSILVKSLLMQALQKDATVYISDFKGGVDFLPIWHERCKMIFVPQSLLATLEELTSELERRRGIFVAAGAPNLSEYNKATGESLHRYILACDEIAEILDTTGMNKAEKEIIGQIVRHLSFIARQGRAFGIHLILSTQRPSADLIPGQIRTNLALRICGRADEILSRVVLDDTSAAEQIPINAQGRFVCNTGQVFQGFLFDEQSI